MNRTARQIKFSQPQKIVVVSLCICLLLLLVAVMAFLRVSSPLTPGQPSATIQSFRTEPDLVVKQYYSYIQADNYDAAYTLLSSEIHRQADPQGGAAYIRQMLRSLTERYSPIVDYTVIKTVKGPQKDQGTVLLQVQRSQFKANQSETDTYEMLFQAGGWVINKWTFDVSTR